jgi:hypothetical protein
MAQEVTCGGIGAAPPDAPSPMAATTDLNIVDLMVSSSALACMPRAEMRWIEE